MTARAFLHRALVLVSGQPDAWATPMNSTPGRLDVDTREAWKRDPMEPLPALFECEAACDIAPDAYRNIAPPPPLDDSTRARLRRRALVLIALGFATLGALLGISDPRFIP
jgi:hypothetical protein